MTRRGWLDRQMERAERQMAVWKEWEEGDSVKTEQPEGRAAPSGRLELLSSASHKAEERGAPTSKPAVSELD
jgi:hypothetical protein